jgi:hypothetical protein
LSDLPVFLQAWFRRKAADISKPHREPAQPPGFSTPVARDNDKWFFSDTPRFFHRAGRKKAGHIQKVLDMTCFYFAGKPPESSF